LKKPNASPIGGDGSIGAAKNVEHDQNVFLELRRKMQHTHGMGHPARVIPTQRAISAWFRTSTASSLRHRVTGEEGPVSSWLRYIPPRSGGWPVLHILASGNTGRNPKTILLEMPIIENKKFGYYRNGKYGARGIVRYGLLFSAYLAVMVTTAVSPLPARELRPDRTSDTASSMSSSVILASRISLAMASAVSRNRFLQSSFGRPRRIGATSSFSDSQWRSRERGCDRSIRIVAGAMTSPLVGRNRRMSHFCFPVIQDE